MILHGDCLEQMRTLDANSVDSIVTDPPYGLSFMGKKWDYDVPSVEIWREALRVLKPGGHLLAFGGTRTYHRLAVNIEDAGFEIRDQIMWLYGSGFPKSMDVSKRIDKEAGAEREVVGEKTSPDGIPYSQRRPVQNEKQWNQYSETKYDNSITAPSTDAAKQWQGWGTALKPANEPIVVARKPLEAKLTVAVNVLKYGTGALNIDASRVAASDEDIKKTNRLNHKGKFDWEHKDNTAFKLGQGADISQGRWPANLILDEEAGQALDAQTGVLKSGSHNGKMGKLGYHGGVDGQVSIRDSSEGGASRFFYCAKSSKRERGEGNVHPTVKPISLMSYLIKLVTPPGGTVLDPFMGSGTTCVAAKSLGFKFIGCELNAEYVEIAEKRIEAVV